MPENALYIEGSILDRFLEGKIELKEVKQNKILVVVNKPALPETINAVSSTRATLGIDAEIIELKTQLRLIGHLDKKGASGLVIGDNELVEQVSNYTFDALAITSIIEVSKKTSMDYYQQGGINPWGGVEAIASRRVADKINKPTAHAPIQTEEDKEADKEGEWDFIVDPRIAPEIISKCYLHCVLKGLHKAPRIGKGLSVDDIDVMVSPYGCWGRPHKACEKAGIPIIVVTENKTICDHPYGHCNPVWSKNYLEAAGVIAAMGAGITLSSVRRPLEYTKVLNV